MYVSFSITQLKILVHIFLIILEQAAACSRRLIFCKVPWITRFLRLKNDYCAICQSHCKLCWFLWICCYGMGVHISSAPPFFIFRKPTWNLITYIMIFQVLTFVSSLKPNFLGVDLFNVVQIRALFQAFRPNL